MRRNVAVVGSHMMWMRFVGIIKGKYYQQRQILVVGDTHYIHFTEPEQPHGWILQDFLHLSNSGDDYSHVIEVVKERIERCRGREL